MGESQFAKTALMPGIAAVIPTIISQSCVQTSQAGAATSDVTGSSVNIPKNHFGPGAAVRITMGGTKSGANAAMIVHISVGGTQVISLTADDASAVDWTAEFIIAAKTLAAQSCIGTLNCLTAAPVADYAGGTVDMSQGGIIKAQIQSQHSSDTVTCEYVLVEYWEK